MLDHFPDVEVIAEISQSDLAVDEVKRLKPDLLLLDVEMPGKTGLEIADELRKSTTNTKVIFVTSHNHYAIQAIRKEAFDYLTKPVDIDDLKAALNRLKGTVQSNLTERELEIIRLIAQGKTSQEIAEIIHLSRHTVDTHRRKILEKTECKNSLELIGFAKRSGML